MPEFDLDTAEGREAFERWIQEMFTRSTLSPEEGGLTFGDLGEMTSEDMLNHLAEMEGLLDQIAEEGEDSAEGQSTSFQTVSKITIEQADKLIAQGSTQIFYLRQIAEALKGEGTQGLGPKIDPGFWNVGLQAPTQGELAKFMQAFSGMTVNFAEGAIQVSEAESGPRTSEDILNAINSQLQESLYYRQRGTGAAPLRTY